MKRVIGLCLCLGLMVLAGCGLSTNQLQAEQAYYDMLKVTMAAAGPPVPIVDIKVADPTKPINLESIKVYLPQPKKDPAQYVQINYDADGWRMLGQVLSIGIPVYGMYRMADSLVNAGLGASTTYNQNVTGTGNSALVKTAGSTVVGGNIGNSAMVAGSIDQTATPTIVTQPPPLVVPTQVVDPVVVDPVVVQIPAPTVVQVPSIPAVTP